MSYVIFENNWKLPFYESISLKCSSSLQNYISMKQLNDGNVNITPNDLAPHTKYIPLRRPSFCPFATLKQNKETDLPPLRLQWIAVACVVLLENKDGFILLTKRPSHMRSFPNIWVAPGGQVESEEKLEDAALRELSEETGLNLSHDDVELNLLCAWESTFPTILDLGMPKYHHLIFYFKVILKFDIEALAINPNEVSAYCWLNKAQVAEIVKSFPDPLDMSLIDIYQKSDDDDQFESIELRTVDTQMEYHKVIRPLSVLAASIPDIRELNMIPERVSTGTKYGLYELLKSYNKS